MNIFTEHDRPDKLSILEKAYEEREKELENDEEKRSSSLRAKLPDDLEEIKYIDIIAAIDRVNEILYSEYKDKNIIGPQTSENLDNENNFTEKNISQDIDNIK